VPVRITAANPNSLKGEAVIDHRWAPENQAAPSGRGLGLGIENAN
jgi:hypothetical protein